MEYGNYALCRYFTVDSKPQMDEEPITLGVIIQSETEVPEKFYLNDSDRLEKTKYLRCAKKINRTSKSGHTYVLHKEACRHSMT